MSLRPLRLPKSGAEFSGIPLASNPDTLDAGLVNLRWFANASKAQTYFASKSGRLTPSSGSVPCLYLAPDEETSFAELYSDLIYAAEANKTTFNIPRKEATDRIFIHTDKVVVRNICDFTNSDVVQDVGIDLGSLYHQDVQNAREFAQRIHDHPKKFDGIKYQSRLTLKHCYVLWETYTKDPLDWTIAATLKDHFRPDPAIAPKVRVFRHVILTS